MPDAPVHLILGASGGIGAALARRLDARGATLFLASRGSERLSALSKALDAPMLAADLSDPEAVVEAAGAAREHFGRLDGIANCVGSMLLKPAHRTTSDELRETLAIHVGSSFGAVQAAAKYLKKEGGAVVLVSSAAARVGLPNHEAIAAAKGAVEGLMLSAAATYAPYGVRFNAVAPGLVKTALTKRITDVEAQRKASEAMHPLGRLGEADEVASAMAWLLDPEQTWITGQVLGVDGGLANVRSRR
jgi:NAD(P)-dependent dehydrogenase (short-subunit alcohol dehydrogenase family)